MLIQKRRYLFSMDELQSKFAMKYDASSGCLNPLVHIGYGKSGSTSVQSVFGNPNSGFASCDSRFASCHDGSFIRHTHIVNKLVIHTHDFEFDPEQLRLIAHEMLGWARPAGLVPVISSERLAGHWMSGGYDSRVIADRIKAVWPEARILLIFREQKSMLSSIYRQYVKKGGGRTFKQLLMPDGGGHGRGPGFSLRHVKYDQLVQYYQEIFGADKILALPLELLRDEANSFFGKIFDFVGANPKHNFQIPKPHLKIGIDAYKAGYKRLVNPILSKDYVNGYSVWCTPYTRIIGGLFMKIVQILATKQKRASATLKLEKEIACAVDGYYGNSNSNLEKLIGIKLDKYEYDLQ